MLSTSLNSNILENKPILTISTSNINVYFADFSRALIQQTKDTLLTGTYTAGKVYSLKLQILIDILTESTRSQSNNS